MLKIVVKIILGYCWGFNLLDLDLILLNEFLINDYILKIIFILIGFFCLIVL